VADNPTSERADRRGIPHANGRAAILERAIEVARASGPSSVHPNQICSELGVSTSLVNFHFGGRDGLLVEVILASAQSYVDELASAMGAAGANPVEALLAWMEAQVEWTAAHPGLAAAFHFPEHASSIGSGFPDEALESLRSCFEQHDREVQGLVAEALRSLAGESREEQDADLDSSLVGWIAAGLSVCSAGSPLLTSASRTPSSPEVLQFAKRRVLDLLAG
jgi:AcrR family transcriptional regulator